MSQNHLHNLINSNVDTLSSAIDLLKSVSMDRYKQAQTPLFESTLGRHVRHILDHYLCFREGLEQGLIDYNQRRRDSELEVDCEYAIETAKTIQVFLSTLKETIQINKPIDVVLCSDVALPEGDITKSSLGRELQFLQSHSVHHFALMAAMLNSTGDSAKSDFGVASSTLAYNKTVKESMYG